MGSPRAWEPWAWVEVCGHWPWDSELLCVCNAGAWCLHSLCLFPLTADDARGCGISWLVLVFSSLPRALWEHKEQH